MRKLAGVTEQEEELVEEEEDQQQQQQQQQQQEADPAVNAHNASAAAPPAVADTGAPSNPHHHHQQHQHQLLFPPSVTIKTEAVAEAERKYHELASAPLSADELRRLTAHYLEPYVSDTEYEAGATRHGTVRRARKLRQCRPRAEQHYSASLWRALEQLHQQAAVQAAGDGGGSSSGSADAQQQQQQQQPSPAKQLLWWLRCIRLYESVCHKERVPLVLQQLGGEGGGGGGADAVIEVVDLVSDDEDGGGSGGGAAVPDVDAWLMENGGCVIVGVKEGDGSLVRSVRVKPEPGG